MSTGGAALSFASAAVGALVGGGVTFLVSVRTLRESHRLERLAQREDDQQAAARRVAAALQEATAQQPDVVGDGSARAGTALARLDVVLAGDVPLLERVDVALRVRRARDLLDWDPQLAARLYDLDADAAGRLRERVASDRSSYTRWVVACLQDVAAGRPAPPDRRPPASLDEIAALPWDPG